MPRRQINVSLTPEDYERVEAAAWEDHVTVSAWCRDAVMDALEGVEEGGDAGEEASLFAAWWLATMALITAGHRGNTNPNPS